MSRMLEYQRKFKEQGEATGATPEETKRVAVIGGGSIGKLQIIELLNDSLEEHLQVLKSFEGIQRKIEYKKNVLIPEYRDYVSRLEDSGQDHPLLGYYLVWLLDAGEIDEALPYGLMCVEKGIELPECFKSKLPTFFVGEVCKWAEGELAEDKSADPYISFLFEAVEEHDWDIADNVSAHLHKCMGFQDEQDGRLEDAAVMLQASMALGGKVKTRLDKIQKKLAAEPAAEADTAEAPATT